MQSIFLIGPMGAGKSTVGRKLARRTGRQFADSDRVIEERANATIDDIFRYEGEDGFRKREVAMVAELTAQPGLVLATGGGAVVDADSRKLLGARGIVIYLYLTPHEQWHRLRYDRSRPLLQVDDPQAALHELFETRDPLYTELSDYRIEIGNTSSSQICTAIIEALDLAEVSPDA